MRAESFLSRLAHTASPYQELSMSVKQSVCADSVFEVAMVYLSTMRRTTVIDATYGVESTSFLYDVLQNDSCLGYFKSIETGLLRNDPRLVCVVVQNKSYRHATNGTIQYLDILLETNKQLTSGDDQIASAIFVRIAYDFTGSIFRVKYDP